MTKLLIASDHGGYELKQKIIQEFQNYPDLEIEDLGPEAYDKDDDYPPQAFKLAVKVVALGGATANVFGVLICRSGVGMSIAANKVDGAFAALCFNLEIVQKAREHNDANILVIDADYEHNEPAAMIEKFINTEFQGGRHSRRVEQIKDYELLTSEEPIA